MYEPTVKYSPQLVRMSGRKTKRASKIHYDFIEIGTSDFNTLIQKADDTTVGLSVEPMRDYLDRLPSKRRVRKVNAAVSNKSGELTLYYIPDHIRKAHDLPSWMKGTNKIGAPHPTVARYLEKHGLPQSLIHTRTVPVLSVTRLFRMYRVGAIDYLKIDTEGHDTVIMNAYLDVVERHPSLRAKKILFESNALSNKAEVSAIVRRLERIGYSIETCRQDTLATLIIA